MGTGGIDGESQREDLNLRPADYEPTGLAFYITDNNHIRLDVKLIVLRLCSPAAPPRARAQETSNLGQAIPFLV